MKHVSYWLDTAPAFTGGARDHAGGKVDLAIIGGGFTGLSTALESAKRGASVAVFEAGRIAGEASGRNGGQCNNGAAQDFAGLVARFGRDTARAMYGAFTAAVNTVERIAREEAIDCDFRRCGRLKLAAKPEHYAKIALSAEILHSEVDADITLIPPERIRDEVDSSAFHGGMLQATSAQLHVGKFGVGLAEAAARRGATIFEHAPVTKIERIPGGHRITSRRGSVDAAQVLVATGNGSVGPFPWYRRRIVPVGSFIIVTEPLDRALLDRLVRNRRNYVTSKNIGHYFRVTPDDRLLFGGRARFAMSNPKSDAKSGDVLRRGLAAIFPELKSVRIDYVWGGSVDMTSDRLPRAGVHDGMFYAMGYSGHGVQMAVGMGPVLADMIEGRAEANPWAHLDWPAVPGHYGKPWFLPFVGAYYRVQDILH